MQNIDYTQLLQDLTEEYRLRNPRSAAMDEKARQYLVDGGSHAIRLLQPFPPRITWARGAWLRDEDGHHLLDYWQGHLGNLLGHNPEVITATLGAAFEAGVGLQTGMTEGLQIECAQILCQQTGAERVRFTTSGTLATMYAIWLGRAYTGRDLIMKVGGGWHGAHPWGLTGVSYRDEYQGVETEGLTEAIADEVLVTRFNDPGILSDHFKQYGERIACFIVEPFIGAGGSIPATQEYLETARQMTEQYGSILILDEVISGFRFRAGDAGALYGVQPDLAVFGKIIGGGMPVAAVAGKADLMEQVGRAKSHKVKFSGGTYSAHPASLLATKTILNHLVAQEAEIYPRLAAFGEQTRRTFEAAFIQEGILARCTGGESEVLPGSSLFRIHFPFRDDLLINTPEIAFDPRVCDVQLSQNVLGLAWLLEDVHMLHSHGAVSSAHAEAELAFLEQASRRVARRVKAGIDSARIS